MKAKKMIKKLTKKEKQILKAVIAPIYFADNSDYLSGLWEVVGVILGDKVDLRDLNPQKLLYALDPELNT
jgi:hypothetical protein